MRKKRILVCGEASFLNTGYATYIREIMTELHKMGKYELAELASWGQRNDPRGLALPWKYYGVQPNTEYEPRANETELKAFQSNPVNQFGSFIFEHVCLEFKPDIVFDIRDYWMMEFADRSPFRDYFNWVIMPTVDAAPQSKSWMHVYKSADAVFSYSQWAGEVLTKESSGKIKYFGTAPPSANEAYKPLDKSFCRGQLLNLDPTMKIVGTVMRNQRRKLYPDLFETFNKVLAEVKDPENYFLYCHTSYPDLGWDMPELLQTYGLSSKVFFTYKCPSTGKIFASLYRGAKAESPFTGNIDCEMCGVKDGADYDQMATVVNTFDIFCQYANSEGFGLPQVEAAACGVPILSTDYSAMSSVVRNLKGYPIKPKSLYKELETGCMRAVPDNDEAAKWIKWHFEETSETTKRLVSEHTRQAFLENYQWSISAGRLARCFDALEIKDEKETWLSNSKIFKPKDKPNFHEKASSQDIAKWLILEVLGDKSKLNTHFESRIVRDLTFGSRTGTMGGMYQNESSAFFDEKTQRYEFNPDIAYAEMRRIVDHKNYWEEKRIKSI